jgi:hypothetical protein
MNTINKSELNAISKMAQTITTPKKNGKVITMLSPEKTLEAIGLVVSGYQASNSGIAKINEGLKFFHDSKIKLCKASEKTNPLFTYSNQVRTMFVDSWKGLKNPINGKAYSMSYIEKRVYPKFYEAVNSGKQLLNMHDGVEKKSTKGSKEKSESDIKKELIKALTSIYANSNNCPEVFEFLDNSINEGSNFLESVTDFLESEGIELS